MEVRRRLHTLAALVEPKTMAVAASGVPKVLAQNMEGLWWKETTAEHEAALAAIVPRAVAELQAKGCGRA